jgi:hypothetical protein
MSLAQTHRQMYDIFSIEEAEALLGRLRDRRKTAIAEETEKMREIYDAWIWRNESGYPIYRPIGSDFIDQITVYHNIPSWLNYSLGLGYVKQDVTQSSLSAVKSKNPFVNFIRTRLAGYIIDNFRKDQSQFETERQKLQDGYIEASGAYYEIQRKDSELALWDKTIADLQFLPSEFAAHQYLEPVVFVRKDRLLRDKVDENSIWSISNELSVEGQHKIQADIRDAEIRDERLTQVIQARSNETRTDYIFGLMRRTRTGFNAIESVRKLKAQILWYEFEEGAKLTCGATYNPTDKNIRVNRVLRKENYFDQIEMDEERQAVSFVHEIEHLKQDHEFPELFSNKLNSIDSYVVMKLTEAGAYAAQDVYVAERAFQTWCLGSRQAATYKHVAGDTEGEVSDKDIYEWLGFDMEDDEEPKSRLWTHYQMTFLGKFVGQLRDNHAIWPVYEEHFHDYEIISALKSGEFEERVRASAFLQPDFLEKFCKTSDDKSYLPVDKGRFFDAVAKWVATVHHPYLASLVSGSSVEEPARESLVHPLHVEQARKLDTV